MVAYNNEAHYKHNRGGWWGFIKFTFATSYYTWGENIEKETLLYTWINKYIVCGDQSS